MLLGAGALNQLPGDSRGVAGFQDLLKRLWAAGCQNVFFLLCAPPPIYLHLSAQFGFSLHNKMCTKETVQLLIGVVRWCSRVTGICGFCGYGCHLSLCQFDLSSLSEWFRLRNRDASAGLNAACVCVYFFLFSLCSFFPLNCHSSAMWHIYSSSKLLSCSKHTDTVTEAANSQRAYADTTCS